MVDAAPLLIERPEPGIAILRLNRPEALNAFTPAMMEAFHEALKAIDEDLDIRVVVLAGEGRGFCAGLDLKSVELAPGGAHHGAIASMALQELFGTSTPRMRRLRQPIVAAVRGAAVGVGFALALAADIRVAGRSSKFLVGAVKIGLVTSLVEDEAVLEMAMETARTIAANSPYAVKHTKQIMWSNLDAPSFEATMQLENHTQVVAILTADFDEATKAFAQKRPPVFKGV